ncbi:MAG TPA: ester cyclase [Mycobacteriales bacterium]|nr:ester cyclase [Mycobacteriales bacterium]
MDETYAWYGDDFCVVEHTAGGDVVGEFMGLPGNGKRVEFRVLHVYEFKDGTITRENVWMDGAAISAQLMAPVSPSAGQADDQPVAKPAHFNASPGTEALIRAGLA